MSDIPLPKTIPTFYHGSIRKIIVAFASIFDEVHFWDGFEREVSVPLHYAPRAKWLETIQWSGDLDDRGWDVTLPRMGFELMGFNFAPERHTNPMNRIHDVMADDSEIFAYNRVPYDFTFDLHIATVRFEDQLKIIEQIAPFFAPELTLTIKDREQYNMENNITVVLNSTALNIDYEGSFDMRRAVTSTLSFTVKGYIYSNDRVTRRIKRAITEYHNADFDRAFERLTASVTPETAGKNDPHEIIETHELVERE